MPSLAAAFRIERATQGGVPVSSWLSTHLGKAEWEYMNKYEVDHPNREVYYGNNPRDTFVEVLPEELLSDGTET
jgi:hypothetical protein